MSALRTTWDQAGLLQLTGHADQTAVVRAFVKGYAQGLDVLVRGLGQARPSTVADPTTWNVQAGLGTAADMAASEAAARAVGDQIDAWAAWYDRAAITATTSPLSLIENPAAAGTTTDSWTTILAAARAARAPSPVIAYLSTQGARWQTALQAAQQLGELGARFAGIEIAHRVWWRSRIAATATPWPTVARGSSGTSSGTSSRATLIRKALTVVGFLGFGAAIHRRGRR